MRLTLFISSEHPPDANQTDKFKEHIEQVEVARGVGFDGVAIGNHMSYGSSAWYPPIETLMRLSAVSGDMSLATCMLVLPMFHPLHVAQQAALLDIVSNGRFTLGVAPGWQEDEFKILGLDYNRRIGRYVESLDLIKRLWTQTRVDFNGAHFQADGLELALKPAQTPRPPFWYGGSVDKAVERAARLSDTALGDSWVASSHLTEDVITRQAVLYQETLRALGKPAPREFPLLRNIVVAPDRETALREAGPFLAASYKIFGQWGLFTNIVGSGKEQLDLEELIAGRVILGSPEECAAELIRLSKTTGFTRLIARIQWLGMDQRIVLRTIRLLAEEVLPIVEKELGA
ncbi:MAG: alkanesulfonate monooxygenase SsuD [Alphaproteobacteria bacterium]|jgi:alkanesulfonate monooxygenase SsuD/methylene tetrahydromethanopterin reductase-like flavin-dependent oxidoreductase (luciferase family)